MTTRQTSLRTRSIKPNDNISFPIGTILAVQQYYERLGLPAIFGRHKRRGRDINALVAALVSYRLTENQSVTKAADWINRDAVLDTFNLEGFEQRTLYRVLEIIGENRDEIMAGIQDIVFSLFDFEHTNVNMDWTSFVLYGTQCPLGRYGYSRDHRPDKQQITLGVSELAHPINLPVGMTVRAGNVNDQVHFNDTFEQIKDRLRKGSLVVFDQGANRKDNLDCIEHHKLNYVTARQINKSDEQTWIKDFDKTKAELVDADRGVYGVKRTYPSRTTYLYFSEQLYMQQMSSKRRKVERLLDEALQVQRSIDTNRGLPKRYQINNPLIDCQYSYQTKLAQLSDDEARAILQQASITGREGFFCLVSSEDLTAKEALIVYRQKDSLEKIFHSFKNEIDISPLRVWTEESIYGALIIGFIAQLFISLIRFEHQELKHTSPKFIKLSLMNLTVTVEYMSAGSQRHIYSNFSPAAEVIVAQNHPFG